MPRRPIRLPTSIPRGWMSANCCVVLCFLLTFLVTSCNSILPTHTDVQPQVTFTKAPQTVTSTPAPTITPLPTASVAPTLAPRLLWLPEYLPAGLRSAIQIPEGYALAESAQSAQVILQVGNENSTPVCTWIYALVAPFPTVMDGVTTDELRAVWDGTPLAAFEQAPLLMDESTLGVLSAYWGEPAQGAVQVIAGNQLLDYAWANRPAWAVVPFEAVSPRWKVLTVDGDSPVRKDFDSTRYSLNIPLVFSGSEVPLPEAFNLPSTNRDASRLTTVAMTGVTAMVRATAFMMEHYGITFPAEEIGTLLSAADITHISNEIPFFPDCPKPQPISDVLVFCSNPKYIDLLKAVGTDVIELTGDHFMDYGAEATLYTLQMYDDLGWPYYGGGADREKARQPVLFEHNGNKIAFMGCNVGCEVKTSIPCTAIATDEHPGAAQCDFGWIASEIERLRQDGYQVIFTFQHIEYYKYTIEPILEADFTRVAEAGASIVSGSQAHQPHGFSFDGESYLHYGLGNLFFDQYHFCAYYACDDAFIDRHIFYNGQYINTELITLRFMDYARPRLMTPEERSAFLETMFNASGW